ncbi:La-related protein 6 [Hordeum vulgare]|nr:La-related protein 6 [Hordeum vulgare]
MTSPLDDGEVGVVCANPLIPKEHLATEVDEDVDYIARAKASSLRPHVILNLWRSVYDIKPINIDVLTWAMSQVKWSTSNASGSTVVDLFKGSTVDLLRPAVKDLRSLYTIEPLLSFLKEMSHGAGLGSLAAKSNLID